MTWRDSAEQGSGFAEYRISVDRAPAISITQSIYPELNAARIAHLGCGVHTITIGTIDRAGNLSLPTVQAPRRGRQLTLVINVLAL